MLTYPISCGWPIFAEIECLRRDDGSVSTLDICRAISRGDDGSDTLTETGDTSDDRNEIVRDALCDIETRANHAGEGYPYSLSENGDVVSIPRADDVEERAYVYLFMLLSTRMNMKTQRVQCNEDATALFEQLCMEAAIRYWGGPADDVAAFVFGTGRHTEAMEDGESIHSRVNLASFRSRVDQLCSEIGEGDGFLRRGLARVTAKDGKLDVVVWRRFCDKRAGQLIGFGQCKTGEHWKNDLAKLRPADFFAKWARSRPAVEPVRLYFICDRVIDQWYEHSVDGGILFDRCRILQHSYGLPTELLARLRTWVEAAMVGEGLRLP